MNYLTIIGIVLIVIILYYIIQYAFSGGTLTSTSSAKKATTISSDKVEAKANFTYSIWFYIDDWNYKFGNTKTILSKGHQNFEINLGKEDNNLNIAIELASKNKLVHHCNVPNVPIQKWVSCIVSIYGRSMDVYINGKLVRTCILENVAKLNKSDIKITPNGGFSGYTSSFQFIPDATNPEEAYNIYKKGNGTNFLASILGKYKFRVEFLKDNQTMTSLEI
jgi:hypothetical protein